MAYSGLNYATFTIHQIVKDSGKEGQLVAKLNVMKEMLDKDPELVNLADAKGLLPIHIAAYVGEIPVVNELIRRGADKDSKRPDGMTPMLVAAMRGSLKHGELCIELCNGGANVNIQGPLGMCALHFLCAKGLADPVEALLKASPVGAFVNAKTRELSTPLHAAVNGGHMDLAELLIDYGADTLAKNAQGKTPLLLTKSREDHDRLVKASPHSNP
jgi:ankyrin repeat protein